MSLSDIVQMRINERGREREVKDKVERNANELFKKITELIKREYEKIDKFHNTTIRFHKHRAGIGIVIDDTEVTVIKKGSYYKKRKNINNGNPYEDIICSIIFEIQGEEILIFDIDYNNVISERDETISEEDKIVSEEELLNDIPTIIENCFNDEFGFSE